MEQVQQTGKSTRDTLLKLSDQLTTCKYNTENATIMAEDLIEYFDIMANPTEENKKFALFCYAQNASRTAILHDYLHQALEQVTAIAAQVSKLHDQLCHEMV